MPQKKYSWIETLYQRSWEMELLISGFVLILLLQSLSQVILVGNWIFYNLVDDSIVYVVTIITLTILPISIIALSIFFSLNLIFRAYWIALIGLMSRIEKKPLQPKFSEDRRQNILQKKQTRKMPQHIDFVDHIGSQIFALAFLFLCYFISLMFCIVQVVTVSGLLRFLPASFDIPASIVGSIYLILLTVFLFDVLTNGVVSKAKWAWLHRYYYFVYRCFRISTGYILYEKVALSGRINGVTKAANLSLFVILALFIFFATVSQRNTFNTQILDEGNHASHYKIVYLSEYDQPGRLSDIAIDKRIYKTMPIKLFIPLTATFTSHLETHCALKDGTLVEPACLNAFFDVHVDNKSLSLNAMFEEHHIGKTHGLSFYIDKPNLQRGQHTIEVHMPFLENPVTQYFWYYP